MKEDNKSLDIRKICEIMGKNIFFLNISFTWGVEYKKIEAKYDARLRKWHIQNEESFLTMAQIFCLLYVPPGYPFTQVSEDDEKRLKLEGVARDHENFDRKGRDDIISSIPVYCFLAR